MAFDYNGIKKEAVAAKQRGGTDGKWGNIVLRCLVRIYDLEKELQESRQLTLFGDVKPPSKTPIGT